MRLVLVGPPGSGKGTQAKRLIQALGLTYIGTGDILRESIRQKTAIGREAEPLLKLGLLVPDPMVNDMVAELFRSAKRPERFVLDGYPRTAAQAVSFDALMRQEYLHLDAVIDLAIDDEEVVNRISFRRVCSGPACGAPYHLKAQPPKVAGVCDLCGAPLICREDDLEETVRRRLVEFHKSTDALLDHYERQGLVKNIPALGSSESIFQTILKSLPPEPGPRLV